MNNLDKQYTALLQDILDNGVEKKDRTVTGTKSVFGRQIRHKMSDGFPLLTTKKMPFKTIVTELIWFLRGDTNIKYLVDNNCHIWDGDVYKNYQKEYEKGNAPGITLDDGSERVATIDEFIRRIKLGDEFSNKFGELGPVYGKQWRSWETYFNPTNNWLPKNYDQIANLINDLKTNPDSRRLMVNAWNVGELDSMVLPPCHYGFQVYTRELSETERFEISLKSGDIPKGWGTISWVRNKEWNPDNETVVEVMNRLNIPKRAISLMWNQRSVDTFLGLPFNIASYGLLLEIIAKEVNMVPDELIGNLGDTHLYLNHLEQAREQIGRELTTKERMDWWFKNNKPNRDVCDYVDGLSDLEKDDHFNKCNVPKRTREPFPLPKLIFNPIFLANLEHKSFDEAINDTVNFQLENYQSHPTIKAPLSN